MFIPVTAIFCDDENYVSLNEKQITGDCLYNGYKVRAGKFDPTHSFDLHFWEWDNETKSYWKFVIKLFSKTLLKNLFKTLQKNLFKKQ